VVALVRGRSDTSMTVAVIFLRKDSMKPGISKRRKPSSEHGVEGRET
jgi:hypothetical protein